MTTPTDVELDRLDVAATVEANQNLTGTPASWRKAYLAAFARAIIEKWGQPQAGASGEPDNAFPLTGKVYKRGAEWVLEISGTINDCNFTCRHTQPGHLRPEDVAGLPLLYTAPPPQVVREPLTDDRIRSMCAQPWVFDTAKQWVRITEAAHGIKGGQHGCSE